MSPEEREAFDAFCIEWAKATYQARQIWDPVEQTYRRLRECEWRFALDTGTRNMLATAWAAGFAYARSGS